MTIFVPTNDSLQILHLTKITITKLSNSFKFRRRAWVPPHGNHFLNNTSAIGHNKWFAKFDELPAMKASAHQQRGGTDRERTVKGVPLTSTT